MTRKIHLGSSFEYHPEYGRTQFLNTFFENPDSILTMAQVMEEQLNARTCKGPRHQAIRNSWWRISTMTKSGIARWREKDTNMMKVIPDLGKIHLAQRLEEHYRVNPSMDRNVYGIEVTQELIDSLDGFEFKRDNFSYHERTESVTVDGVLEDPILAGICGNKYSVLRNYLTTLFEIGGIPKRRETGTLECHLSISPASGVDNPTIDFYKLGFMSSMFSNSPIRRYIQAPWGFSDEYPTVVRQ